MMKKIFIICQILKLVSAALIVTSCTQNSGQEKIRQEETKLDSLARIISNDFSKISLEISSIASFITQLYENQNTYQCKNPGIYKLDKSGVLYKPVNDGGSAIFVSGYIPVNDSILKVVYFTEPLDSLFKVLIETNTAIAQVYYNDRYSINRIYPYFDVLTQYEARMNIPEFNFYYLADEQHNPERKAVWVAEPYVDPAGRGWMISAIAPVYFENRLEGVPGIDITISDITGRYFNEENKDLIITDSSGVIVSADEYIINLLEMPTLKTHKYFETIKQDTYLKDDYNLLKSKNEKIRNTFKRIIKDQSRSESLSLEGENYQAVMSKIEQLNWFLIRIVKI